MHDLQQNKKSLIDYDDIVNYDVLVWSVESWNFGIYPDRMEILEYYWIIETW